MSLPAMGFASDLISMVPVGVHTPYGAASDWVGMGVGDVNGDGEPELVAVRNFDADIYVLSISKDGSFEQVARYTGLANNSKFSDLDVGDVDNDGVDEIIVTLDLGNAFYLDVSSDWEFTRPARSTVPGQWSLSGVGDVFGNQREEFVTFSNRTGDISIWTRLQDGIALVAQNQTAGNNSQWAGVEVGDVDNDGEDEIVAIRNFDGDIFVYELQPNRWIRRVARETSGEPSDKWADIEIVDLNGDGKNELVAISNHDGDFHIFEVDEGEFRALGVYSTPQAIPLWRRLESIDFDNDGDEEIIAVREDGDFYVYDGVNVGSVGVFVRFVLGAGGTRPLGSEYYAPEDVEEAIREANQILENNGATFRLQLDNVHFVGFLNSFYDMMTDEVSALETAARRVRATFSEDAINIFVVDDLKNQRVRVGGTSSFPGQGEVVVINSHGIPGDGAGWLKEIAHYLSLTSTYGCPIQDLRCVVPRCMGQIAFHASSRGAVECNDVCPDKFNLMAGYLGTIDEHKDVTLYPCQLDEMIYELCNPEGSRNHVYRPSEFEDKEEEEPEEPDEPEEPEEGDVIFLRGDINVDGNLGLSDAIRMLEYLFRGGNSLACPDSADVDDGGNLNLGDAVLLLNALFRGDQIPAPTGECGVDPTPDVLPECEYNHLLCP